MKIIRKDATISPTGADDEFPGSFEVILSAPTEDRDGETLLPEEWKQPLPPRITFDSDHGMSVATTVGSGVPRIDPSTGNLIVAGTYSSLPRAQEVRTLVNEGHIQTTSVAFMSSRSPQKDGKQTITRELLNGAFVAIPSNREALVMASKSVEQKVGARNAAADMEHIQAAHDHTAALGAACGAKSYTRKDADTEDQSNPVALVQGVDAAIDQAIDLFATVDATTLPAEVQQAIALIQAADATLDALMDAVGIPDPDEDAESGAAEDAAPDAAPQGAAADAAAKAAPVEEVDSDAVMARALPLLAARFV
jgi:hypothetical protein